MLKLEHTELVEIRKPHKMVTEGYYHIETANSLRAGVCRPCDTIELTATSCNFSLCQRVEKVSADRQLFRYSWSRSYYKDSYKYVVVREHG